MTESRSVVVRLSADTASYIAQITAAGKATDKAFDGVDGKVDATNTRMVELETSTRAVGDEMSSTSTKTKALEKDLDSVSGRVKLLAQLGVTLGPALAPLGAVGIAGAVGLTTQLGFVAGGLGTVLLASVGVKDALTAANQAAIIPTSENLAKANAEISKLGPDAQNLVTQLIGLRDVGASLRDRAAAGVFPGVSSFLDDALKKTPAVTRVIGTLADATGEVFANAGQSLAGGRFNEFFQFLNQDAPRNISGLATATGNLAHAGTEVLQAFSPLELDFIDVLVRGTERLDQAASGLEESDGFRNFADYVRETGPQVASTAGAIGNALVDIVSAAAPLGGPTLQVIESIAHVFSDIADSDIGTPLLAAASGFTIFSRAQGLLERGGRVPFIRDNYVNPIKELRGQIPTLGEFGTVLYRAGQSADVASNKTLAARESVRGFTRDLAPVGKLAAGVGAVALAATGASDSLGLANTATLGLAGSMAGPFGAAIGTAVGLTLDFAHANDDLKASIDAANAARSSTNIDDLTAAQDRLVASFAAATDKGGFSGALGRVSSYLGGDVKEFSETYDDLQGKINDLKDGSSGLTELLTAPFDGVARSAQLASLSVEDYTTQVQISLGLLSDQAAYDGYKAAIDSVTKALKDNGKTLDANSEKGRGNRQVLRDIAQTALNYSTTIQDPGKRQDFLANARRQYIDAATDLGKLPKAARAAADELGLLAKVKAKPTIDVDDSDAKPKTASAKAELKALDRLKVKSLVGVDADSAFAQMYGVDTLLGKLNGKTARPKVNVDPGGSFSVIDGVQYRLNNLRDKTVYINTIDRRAGAGGQGPAATARADGGRISGPGGPRDDLVPVMASNGEFIVNARDTARNLWLLEKINAGLPAFADGGHVDNRNRAGRPLTVPPLFDGEGPRYYAKAYRHNKPFAVPGPAAWEWPYQTTLNSDQATAFEDWVRTNGVPFDPTARIVDYDMRGYWRKTKGRSWHPGDHFPDTFKTPYDTTFSHESKYATADNPFYWHGDRLIDQRNGRVIFAADGGLIRGPGGPRDDVVPVMASNGEFVVNARDTARNLALLQKLNAGLPAYADGGEVGDKAPTKAQVAARVRKAQARAKANRLADQSVLNFEIDLSIDDSGLSSAADSFKDEFGAIKDRFKDANRKVSDGLQDQAKKIRASSVAYDKLTASLQATVEAQQAFESQVGVNNDPFGNGLAGLNAQLDADTNDNTAFLTALKTAVGNGLDGELFKALSTSNDLTTAQQIAGLDSSGISALEAKYAGATGSRTALASFAGDRAFGQALADNKALIQRQSQLIERQTRALEKLPNAVRDGAEKGTHDGAATGVRAGTGDSTAGQGSNSKTSRRGGRNT